MTFSYLYQLFIPLKGSIKLFHLLFGYHRIVLAANEHYRQCGTYLLEQLKVVFLEERKFEPLFDLFGDKIGQHFD
jgi:hypothetical protein